MLTIKPREVVQCLMLALSYYWASAPEMTPPFTCVCRAGQGAKCYAGGTVRTRVALKYTPSKQNPNKGTFSGLGTNIVMISVVNVRPCQPERVLWTGDPCVCWPTGQHVLGKSSPWCLHRSVQWTVGCPVTLLSSCVVLSYWWQETLIGLCMQSTSSLNVILNMFDSLSGEGLHRYLEG